MTAMRANRAMPRDRATMPVLDALGTIGGSTRMILDRLAAGAITWGQVRGGQQDSLRRCAFVSDQGAVTDRGRSAVGLIRGSGQGATR